MNERFRQVGHQIVSSDWWNIGFIGESQKIIMEKNRSLLSKIWQVGWRTAVVAGIAKGTTACGPTSNPELPSQNNDNSSEFDQNKPKAGQEWQKESLASFLSSKPEYQGREMFAINIKFPLKGIESNTIVITPDETDKAEIESYKYSFDGNELQPYTDAIVYTMKTDENGKTEWVRLAGVWFPTEDGSVNTAWYYSRDAFKPDVNTVNFNQRVLGFNSNSDQFVFWPLVEPPYTLDWSENIGSTDVSQFLPWNGIDPYTFSLGTIPTGFSKVLFAPVPFDAPTQTPTPTESPTASYGPQFTEEYLAKFESVQEGTRVVAGEEKKVVLGTDIETQVEQVIGMEMDGQMVRMGEWIDADGRSFYAYIPEGWNVGNRIGVNTETPKIIYELLIKSLSEGQFTGMTEDELKEKIWNNNGVITFKSPTAPDKTDPAYQDNFAVVQKDMTIDLTKPIKISVITSDEEFKKLSQADQDLTVDFRGTSDGNYVSGFLMKSNAGQLEILSIDTFFVPDAYHAMNPQTPTETSNAIKYFKSRIGINSLKPVAVLKNYGFEDQAYFEYSKFSPLNLANQGNRLFDYTITAQDSSQ